MTRYTIYRLDTGEIASSPEMAFAEEHRETSLAAALAPWGADAHAITEGGSDPARHFVATLGGEPAVQERPAMQARADRTAVAADGVDEATLTGLPDPCTITVDADDPDTETSVHEVAGGGFVFAAETPGTYSVTVDHWPFLPWRVEFTAT